jgi:hypothetical protein
MVVLHGAPVKETAMSWSVRKSVFRTSKTLAAILLFLSGFLLLSACNRRDRTAGGGLSPNGAADCTCRSDGKALTRRFVEVNLPRYRRAMELALGFFDSLHLDPLALRQQGMKGRKKLVELLDAYVAVHRHSTGKRKVEVAERFRRAAAVMDKPEYHDMATVDDEQFKQDATTYLRACYLLDKMGLDTKAYLAEIRKLLPRLEAHFKDRGPHQRMAFRFYYQHFKQELPESLRDPFKDTITRRRLTPYFLTLNEVYDLTHEVFVPYDYGGNLHPDFFDAGDRVYLRRALEVLATFFLSTRNADLLGEILASLRYLGEDDLAVYRDGIDYLLTSQRPNGSFGSYEILRAKRGDRVDVDLYLHTTSVAMDILPLAFEGPR